MLSNFWIWIVSIAIFSVFGKSSEEESVHLFGEELSNFIQKSSIDITVSPKFYFIPPRSIYLIWKNEFANYDTYLLRINGQKKLTPTKTSCNKKNCFAVWSDGLVGAFTYKVKLADSNGKTVFEEIFYLPWQLTFGVTSSTLLVEWDTYYDFIDKLCVHNNSTKVADRCMEADMSEILIDSLKDDTIYTGVIYLTKEKPNISFIIKTSSRDVYYSLDWVCGNEYCTHGQDCVPGDRSLVRQKISQFHDYFTSCSCNKERSLDKCGVYGYYDITAYNSIMIQTNIPIIMNHAEFYAYKSKEIPGCELPSSLSLTSYWCNSLNRCIILFPRMLSFFNSNVGCSNMNDEQYLFAYKLNSANRKAPTNCAHGSKYFPEHKTCYKHIRGKHSFLDGRNLCMSYGGDIPYEPRDNLLKRFLKINFHISDSVWILGWSDKPRPHRQYLEESEKAIIHITSGRAAICYDDLCNEDMSLVCALPPIIGDANKMNEFYDHAPACDSESCMENCADCWWMKNSIGHPSHMDRYEVKMCLCCSHGENSCKMVKETVEPEDGLYYVYSNWEDSLIDITYAYLGYNGTNSKVVCRSYSALALLQLKCNGKSSCVVNERDMQSHLSSSCHPILNAPLTIAMEYVPNKDFESFCECVSGWDFIGIFENSCLYITSDRFSDSKLAKYECNNVGADLAYFKDSIPPWYKIPKKYTAGWAELYVAHQSEKRFFIYPHNAIIFYRKKSVHKSKANAFCVGPPKFRYIDSTSDNDVSNSCVPPIIRATTTFVPETPVTESPKMCIVTDIPDTISKNWPDQQSGITSIQPCPDPLKGNATWTCNKYGQWETEYPDLSNCTYLIDYEEYSDKIFDIDIPLSETLIYLQDVIEEGTMAPGDIPLVLDLLNDAEERNAYDLSLVNDPREILFNYTKNFISVLDNSLGKTMAWLGLQGKTRMVSINRLQQATTEVAVNFSVNSLPKNSQEIYAEDDMHVVIENQNKKYYQDTNNRKFCHPEPTFEPTCITLPETMTHYQKRNRQISVTMFAYKTLHCLFPRALPCTVDLKKDVNVVKAPNTAVMGSTVGKSAFKTSKNHPVVATFKHIYPGDKFKLSNKTCVWWNNEDWDASGCVLNSTNNTITTCHCDHLTNLAVIMDISRILNGREAVSNLTRKVTIVGISLSIICLSMTIVLLIKNVNLSRKTNMIHINLCTNLLLSEIILMAGLNATDNQIGCAVVAGLLFYFLLTTFTWSAIEAVNVYFLFVKIFYSGLATLKWYAIFAYGIPALIVVMSAAISAGNGFGTNQYCWIDFESPLIFVFALPILIILVINCTIYCLSIKNLIKHRQMHEQLTSDLQPEKKMLRASITLASVLCITWLFGFTYVFHGSVVMAAIFTIVNSMQGVVLFVVLILFNKDIITDLKNNVPSVIKAKLQYAYNITVDVVENKNNEESTNVTNSNGWSNEPKPVVIDATIMDIIT